MKPFLVKFLNIFHFRRQTVFFAVFGAVFVLIVALALPNRALAGFSIVDDIVVPAAGFVASVFFSLLGKLLSAIISALIQIAKYNRIIDQPTVQSTWVIMRDFVNMFFVFAILLIAFSTILRIQQYGAKQLLPKLILYAVLVNFSLTICGLFIDIAQVVMMTFVNAFEGTALNNLTSMTGLLDYGNLQLDSGTANSGEVLAGYILAIAFMVVAIITIGAMMVILLIRILMLWILAILSPFAFVLPVIPGGQKYAGQWWSMFSNYVVSGPLLAFFIWLALTVVGENTSIGTDIIHDGGVTIVKTKVGNSGFFINFLIAIGMLFAGLMLTSSLGGAMGKIAGGASSKMQGVGMQAAKWARRKVGYAGLIGGIATGGIGGVAIGMGARALSGWGLRNFNGVRVPLTNWRIPGTRDSVVGRWAQDRHDQKQRKNQQNRQRIMEKLGMGDRTFERISDWSHRSNIPVRPGTSWGGRALRFLPATILGTTYGAANLATRSRRQGREDEAAFGTGAALPGAGQWYTFAGLGQRRYHMLDHLSAASETRMNTLLAAGGTTPDIQVAIMNALAAYRNEKNTRNEPIRAEAENVYTANEGAYTGNPDFQGNAARVDFITGIDANKMRRTITERERLGLDSVSSEDLVKTAEAAKIDRDFAVRQKTPAREVILERMRQGESPDDIINSVKSYEEKVAKGEYYNGERVDDVKRQQEAYEKWEKGGDVNKMTGIGGSEREVSKGRGAQLAVNFDDETLKGLDLQGAGGAYISGDNKKQAAAALSEYLYKQLSIENAKKESGQQQSDEEITNEVEQFQQMLQQAKGVSLINKAQTWIGADERSLHEKFHRNLNDVDQEQMMGAWNAMPEEERKNTEEKIRGTIKGGKDMPIEKVVEEYLVEGLTNATGRGRGDTKLDQKTLDQFEQMGVVRKMEQKTATGEMRTIYRPTKEASKEKTELERKWEDEAQAKPHTLTEKAAQEEGVEVEKEAEGKIEKEDAAPPKEEKKEEKTTQAAPAYSAAEIKTTPQVQSEVKQIMESSAKGMTDPLFFRKMSAIFNKAIGTLAAKSSGAGAVQTGRLLKSIGGLKESSEHTQSDNPLIRESAKQEYNIKLEEFRNEYYNAVGENPASEDEIKDAIGNLK